MTEANLTEQPADRQAVLWREDGGRVTPILNAGEVGFLAGPHRSGRREIALDLAAAAAMAETGAGSACGLSAMGLSEAGDRCAIAKRPRPLWVRETRAGLFEAIGLHPDGPEAQQLPARQGDYWRGAFEAPPPLNPSLVVINPLADAFAGRPFDVAGMASLMASLGAEGSAGGFAVLLVAEDGKTARAAPKPTRNAVSGSSIWFDMASAVLHLKAPAPKVRTLQALKIEGEPTWPLVARRGAGGMRRFVPRQPKREGLQCD